MMAVPYAVMIICFASMVIAQVLKFLFDAIKNKKINSGILISTGGMPSSHSSLVISLVVSIGLFQYNLEGNVGLGFAIAAVLAVVVIHDAMGVRYEASKHARELNIIKLRLNLIENIDIEEKKLKESLGHKPKEVLAGIILGIIVAIIGFLILK